MRKPVVPPKPPRAPGRAATPITPPSALIARRAVPSAASLARAWPLQRAAAPVVPSAALKRVLPAVAAPRASAVIQRAAPRAAPEWKEVVSDNSSHGGMHAHVVPVATAATGKMATAFANPEHVRLPRSFRAQPVRQVLRWLATSILAQFPKGVEIQCYLHRDVIYVSSNKDSINAGIDRALKGKTLLPAHASAGAVPQERVARHQWKLARAATTADEAAVKALLARHAIVVVAPYDYGCDFHAERRIAHALGVARLDPNFLAGTRRACMACAVKLQLDNNSHAGLLYTSKAGLGARETSEKDALTAEIKAYAAAHGLLSYVSLDRHTGAPDDNHDTDSEDDS